MERARVDHIPTMSLSLRTRSDARSTSSTDLDIKIISTVYLPGRSRAHADSTQMQETRRKATGCPRSAFITHVHYLKMKAQRQPNINIYRPINPLDRLLHPILLRKTHRSYVATTFIGPPKEISHLFITTDDLPHTRPSRQDWFSQAGAEGIKHISASIPALQAFPFRSRTRKRCSSYQYPSPHTRTNNLRSIGMGIHPY